MNLLHIGLAGPMASGKSTLAGALASRYGYRQQSLATPIKDLAAAAYPGIGKSDSLTVWPEFENHDTISGRQLLQRVGAALRGVDRDVWVRLALSGVSRDPQGPRVVIDDVRFENEVALLRQSGFTIVWVETPTQTRLMRYAAAYGRHPTLVEMAHPSEPTFDRIQPDLTVSGDDDPIVTAESIWAALGQSDIQPVLKETVPHVVRLDPRG